MSTNIIKINFIGQVLYIGMDVHLKSWVITILSQHLFLKKFTLAVPGPMALIEYLRKHYPGAVYRCVYEAGYSGYWIAKQLIKSGIQCLIVNPADVPQTNKQKDQKTDKMDSQKLAEYLRAGLLKGIYIPAGEELEDRSLTRIRTLTVRIQSATKNRIKSFLSFYGITITDEQVSRHWSNRYMQYIKSIKFKSPGAQYSFESLLRQLDFQRKEVLELTRRIRNLAKEDKYRTNTEKLCVIPGIGTISAMVILTELMNICRFNNVKQLRSFIGIIPSESSSGDKENKDHMTRRGNSQLKRIIIECSWVAVRTDPAMTLRFEELIKKMKKSKAIIRIARKLINRIMLILATDEQYELSVA